MNLSARFDIFCCTSPEFVCTNRRYFRKIDFCVCFGCCGEKIRRTIKERKAKEVQFNERSIYLSLFVYLKQEKIDKYSFQKNLRVKK